MEFPKDFLFTEDHEYAKVEGDIAVIGVSEYAQEQLGDITYVELPQAGAKFSKGDSLGVIEAVKAASDIYSPVSGEVVEVNSDLESNPELINSDCYGKGWIIKLRLSNKEELSGLMNSEDYKSHVE
ncbi:MAG: glycine cleavage system protein GcvH [Candidatus Delongbacteria bacterium]|jgi:glycine cleavage system H protein|nr:glycine cleavage system protein GcvH [Candidatus Delongbacteria bacterium]MDY0017298.1 glycine cleavage system protein GcvH [Candidatus Delongbacteria bacterium]